MRTSVIGLTAAALLAACSAPADVLVTRADAGGSGPNTAATVHTTTTTTSPGERPPPVGVPGGLVLAADLLLTAADVPNWVLDDPTVVPAETPPHEAVDCDPVNAAWATVASDGVRVNGTIGTARFRNTVVVLPDGAAAGAILDAAEQVPTACPLFHDVDGLEWWSEPLDLGRSPIPSATLVLGGDAGEVTALGFWQVDDTVVVLEVSGHDMWLHLDSLMTSMAIRIAEAAASTSPTTEPGTRPVESVPGTLPAVSTPKTTVPANTTPNASTTTTTEFPPPTAPRPAAEFPPLHEDWAAHPLAALAPHPSEVGAGWSYANGSVTEAEPADPDDGIDGCDVAAPPTLAGLSLSYEVRASDDYEQFELELGLGTAAEITSVIDAFRDVAGCDLSEVGYTDGLTIVDDVTFDGASDSIVLTSTFDGGADFSMALVIVGAAYDDLFVFVFQSAGADKLAATVEHAADTVRLVASKR